MVQTGDEKTDAGLLLITGLFVGYAELSFDAKLRAISYAISIISGSIFIAHKLWSWYWEYQKHKKEKE